MKGNKPNINQTNPIPDESNLEIMIKAVQEVINWPRDDILRVLKENNYETQQTITNILDGLAGHPDEDWKQVPKKRAPKEHTNSSTPKVKKFNQKRQTNNKNKSSRNTTDGNVGAIKQIPSSVARQDIEAQANSNRQKQTSTSPEKNVLVETSITDIPTTVNNDVTSSVPTSRQQTQAQIPNSIQSNPQQNQTPKPQLEPKQPTIQQITQQSQPSVLQNIHSQKNLAGNVQQTGVLKSQPVNSPTISSGEVQIQTLSQQSLPTQSQDTYQPSAIQSHPNQQPRYSSMKWKPKESPLQLQSNSQQQIQVSDDSSSSNIKSTSPVPISLPQQSISSTSEVSSISTSNQTNNLSSGHFSTLYSSSPVTLPPKVSADPLHDFNFGSLTVNSDYEAQYINNPDLNLQNKTNAPAPTQTYIDSPINERSTDRMRVQQYINPSTLETEAHPQLHYAYIPPYLPSIYPHFFDSNDGRPIMMYDQQYPPQFQRESSPAEPVKYASPQRTSNANQYRDPTKYNSTDSSSLQPQTTSPQPQNQQPSSPAQQHYAYGSAVYGYPPNVYLANQYSYQTPQSQFGYTRHPYPVIGTYPYSSTNATGYPPAPGSTGNSINAGYPEEMGAQDQFKNLFQNHTTSFFPNPDMSMIGNPNIPKNPQVQAPSIKTQNFPQPSGNTTNNDAAFKPTNQQQSQNSYYNIPQYGQTNQTAYPYVQTQQPQPFSRQPSYNS